MARIAVAFPEHDTSYDVRSNPEILYMLSQYDEDECDVTEALWLSGQAVTQPKNSKD